MARAKKKIQDKKIETSLFQLVGGAIVVAILVLALGVIGVIIALAFAGVFWWIAFSDGAKSIQSFIKEKTK